MLALGAADKLQQGSGNRITGVDPVDGSNPALRARRAILPACERDVSRLSSCLFQAGSGSMARTPSAIEQQRRKATRKIVHRIRLRKPPDALALLENPLHPEGQAGFLLSGCHLRFYRRLGWATDFQKSFYRAFLTRSARFSADVTGLWRYNPPKTALLPP